MSARACILTSAWYPEIMESLEDGARRALEEGGVDPGDITVVEVPGAFELGWACVRAGAGGRFDLVVALGCVIRGETPHFDFVCAEAARGVGAAARATGIPTGFGVLTCEDRTQAAARAGGAKGNKGEEAARAALACLAAQSRLDPDGKGIPGRPGSPSAP